MCHYLYKLLLQYNTPPVLLSSRSMKGILIAAAPIVKVKLTRESGRTAENTHDYAEQPETVTSHLK
jgi:hypothetical protein